MLKKICGFLSTILLLVLLALAAVLILPKVFGMETMAVISGSMEPEIPVGSIVCVKETEPSRIQPGDIITYRIGEDTRVTHRVVSNDTTKQEIITKGDANDASDASPVVYADVVGKEVFHLPYVGYISIYARTPLGIGAVCGLVAVILLLTFLPDIFSEEEESPKSEKKKKSVKNRKSSGKPGKEKGL